MDIMLILVVVVVVGLVLMSRLLNKEDRKLPYVKKGYILTKTESYFYKQLKPIVDSLGLSTSLKVRLWDVVDVKKGTEKRLTYQNKISSKHIDFVLYDGSMKIIACIELDDPSHNRKEARIRDQEKNRALEAAGVPLIRIKTTRNYDAKEIRNKIESALNK